ncbi:sulfotransferase [Polynucleobacter asymbioticus]|jgi:hypothetical protein|uniref:Sulfotransferase n=1 Tax=Polynucleobacter asymbioticus TaxID=576611 RepID=A0AAC9IPN1_9BURK|nr:sulfotransferase [Polynucleobacter asymbioticus]APB98188.1 hypothetical protein A4F89_01975 [Polynucleobacter asymbioticus]APC00474.1 hypothetical protein AOC25_01980 [Polynucleobacter asymbioticus]
MKKFVIGIGSQRAGSTLLHRLLKESTNIYMHPLKELHYFDTKYKVRGIKALQNFSRAQLFREINLLVNRSGSIELNKDQKAYLRANSLLAFKDIGRIEYLDLYRPNIADNEILGEITPEYMLLPEVGIVDLQNTVGKDATILLICRNPVKRFISSVKLLINYHDLKSSHEEIEGDIIKRLEESDGWLSAQDKFNDYQVAIEKFKKHFDNLVVINYDNFINNPSIIFEQLRNSLRTNIDENVFNSLLEQKINTLGAEFNPGSRLSSILKNRYSKSSEFINDYFSSTLTL